MILLGIVHMYFASTRVFDIDTLWFIGSGFTIIFPGVLNLVAIHKGYSKFAYILAGITNLLVSGMFCLARAVMDGPQVYVGIAIFFIASLAFVKAIHSKS